MATRLCLPISDTAPNLISAVPAGPHYQQVAQEPHDGDATILSATFLSASYQTALRIGGVLYDNPGPAHAVQFQYQIIDDSFLTDPSDGAVWTKSRVAACNLCLITDSVLQEAFGLDTSAILATDQITGVRIRVAARQTTSHGTPVIWFTEAVILVDVLDPPARPTGGGASTSNIVSGASQSGSAAAISQSAGEIASALAVGAAGAVLEPSAAGSVPASSGTAASQSNAIAGAPQAEPTAVAVPIKPTASAVSLSPSVTAQIIPISGTGS